MASERGALTAGLLTLLLFAGVVPERTALAQRVDDLARAAARTQAEEGLSLYDAGKFAEALERFNRADAVMHAPTMGLMAARCLEKIGRLVESEERYLAVTRVALPADSIPAQRDAQVNAAKERSLLLPRIPTLEVDVVGIGVAVTIDGRPMSEALVGARNPLDPGHHRIEARRGNDVATKGIDLKEGAAVTLLLAPVSAVAPLVDTGQTQRLLGAAALGLGAAGLGLGVVAGLIVLHKQSDLEAKGCANGTCPQSAAADVPSYDTMRTLSTVGFVVGLVSAAGGLTLVLTAPHAKPNEAPSAREIEPWLGPGGVGVRGVF